MGFIKKLFRKKESIVKPVKEEPIQEVEEISNERICDACGLGIHGDQKSVCKAGKRYHVKPCWRNLQKMAKKEAFG